MKTFLDLDGTIVDSTQRHVLALKDILLEEGIEVNIDNYLSYKRDGFSTKQYLENMLGLSTLQSVSISNKWVKVIEDQKYLLLDSLYDDSNVFLDWLSMQGSCIYILTARKNERLTYEFLKNSGIQKKIIQLYVVSPSNATEEKKHILSKHVANEFFYIGDTEADFDACKGIDIQMFVLNRGFRSKKYWDNRGVETYSNLHEIKRIMSRMICSGGEHN